MEVTIQKGQLTAIDKNGFNYKIEGIKIVRQQTKEEIFYSTEDNFYKVACAENTTSQAYLLPTGNIMLL